MIVIKLCICQINLTAFYFEQVIECSFGRLKSRFAALRRAMDINLDDLPHVIYACFVLHNYCETTNQPLEEQMVTEVMRQERTNQPDTLPNFRADSSSAEGKRVRRVLTEYLDP